MLMIYPRVPLHFSLRMLAGQVNEVATCQVHCHHTILFKILICVNSSALDLLRSDCKKRVW